MRTITCAAARRRLQAFHDRELAVGDQIAMAAHLEGCRDCAAALGDLELIASAMRMAAPGCATLTHEEAAGFHAGVVSRAKAERDAAFLVRIRGMFEDLHLVYAGFGAAVATIVCVLVMQGMIRFATNERSDSLAAIVAFLATPGSNANAITIDAASQARWTARFQAATESAEQDAVFTLAAAVTRDGRITNLERLRARGPSTAADEVKLIETLMDAVSRARFEPVQGDGLPGAVNIVWLVTHTTVRASNNVHTLDLVLPAVKKRAAFIIDGRPRIVAV